MRWAFTGSEWPLTPNQSLALDRVISDEIMQHNVDKIHHGGCKGADDEFHELLGRGNYNLWAHVEVWPGHIERKRGKSTSYGVYRGKNLWVIHQPEYTLTRNRLMVDVADRLIAAPDGVEVLRSGTWATVRYARKKHRPITFVWPNGEVTHETSI